MRKIKIKTHYLPNNHRHFFARVSARFVLCAQKRPEAVVARSSGEGIGIRTNKISHLEERMGWDDERARDERKLGWIMIESDFTTLRALFFFFAVVRVVSNLTEKYCENELIMASRHRYCCPCNNRLFYSLALFFLLVYLPLLSLSFVLRCGQAAAHRRWRWICPPHDVFAIKCGARAQKKYYVKAAFNRSSTTVSVWIDEASFSGRECLRRTWTSSSLAGLLVGQIVHRCTPSGLNAGD